MYRYETPIMKLRSAAYGKNYWVFSSRKLKRRVGVFSNIEYENILTLEMTPDVEWYCEYPLKPTVFLGGKEFNPLFSTWVKYRNGTEIYQGVAYQNDAGEESEHCTISAAAAWCIQNGQKFEFRNEKNIKKGIFYIRNLSVLASRAQRFRVQSVNADQMLIGYLKGIKRASISELENSGRFETGRTLDYLADLYYRGIIDFVNISNECINGKMEVICDGK